LTTIGTYGKEGQRAAFNKAPKATLAMLGSRQECGKNWQGMQGKYFIQLLECKGWEVNAINVIHCKGVYITGETFHPPSCCDSSWFEGL